MGFNKKGSNSKPKQKSKGKKKTKLSHGNLDSIFAAAANDDIHQEQQKTTKQARFLGIGVLIVALALALFSPFGEDGSKDTTVHSPAQSPTSDERPLDNTNSEHPEMITKVIQDYKIVKILPHDTKAFTQGLTFRPNNSSIVYESTGMYNESEIRILDLETGTAIQESKLPAKYFGEGMTFVPSSPSSSDDGHNTEGRLVLITYKEQTGMILDVDSLEILEEFQYNTTTTQGWGIIHIPKTNTDEKELPYDYIVTDGSHFLHFWDSQFQEVQPKLQVSYLTEAMASQGMAPQPMPHLNELEWDPSTQTILANVYFQDVIVRIDPITGFATTFYDVRSLYTDRIPKADVFNGIALSPEGNVWVTGKYWPYLYQIELREDIQ